MKSEPNKSSDLLKVLLIEDNSEDAKLITALLARAKKDLLRLNRTTRLSEALKLLAEEEFDLVLSDLGLPDSEGMNTFIKVHSAYPDIPVIVLTEQDDEDIAFEAVHRGAQDYVVKGTMNAEVLLKAVKYAGERQKLLVELKNRVKEIRDLERERERLLSMFAHDIKSALTPAVGFLDSILSGKTEKMQDRLERAIEELMSIERLVTDFLDFARLDTKDYRPSAVSCDLDALIRGQIDTALDKAEKKNILIRYEPGECLPVIEADSVMIKRVIMNLLDNAVKYTDPGGSVTVRVIEKGDYLHVEVQDSGRGISPEKVPFVFDAFYRASRDQRGSGLGLTISKTIVEAHGGQVWVVSTPGRGSMFGFSLPKQALGKNAVNRIAA